MGAGARAGKRKLIEDQIFFFNINKLYFLNGGFVLILNFGYWKKLVILELNDKNSSHST